MSGQVKKGYARPLDIKHGRVDMSHGGGGRAMAQLITDLFAAPSTTNGCAQGNDGTCLPLGEGRWWCPPTATWSRRCSSRAATSAACRCTAPSTTSP
jgi:hypothetical protein